MQITKYVNHNPVSEAVFYDGTEDTALADWLGGELEEIEEGVWVVKWTGHLGIEQSLSAGNVIYRTEQGNGVWSEFFKTTQADFLAGFDLATVQIGFASQNPIDD